MKSLLYSFIHLYVLKRKKKAQANQLPCPCWTLEEADQIKGTHPTTPTERDAPSGDPPSVTLALLHLLVRCHSPSKPTFCLMSY